MSSVRYQGMHLQFRPQICLQLGLAPQQTCVHVACHAAATTLGGLTKIWWWCFLLRPDVKWHAELCMPLCDNVM